MTLLAEQNSGIYVVVNGDGVGDTGGGTAAVERVSEAFIEHFYPHKDAPAKLVQAKDTDRFAGTYRYSRISDTDISRALAAMIVTVGVTANADGTLTTNGQLAADPTQTTTIWQPIGERLFQQKGGTDLLSFKQSPDGRVVSMSLGSDPTVGWDRLRWYEVPSLHFAVVVGSLVVLLTMLAWPVLALVRKVRNGQRAEGGRAARITAHGVPRRSRLHRGEPLVHGRCDPRWIVNGGSVPDASAGRRTPRRRRARVHCRRVAQALVDNGRPRSVQRDHPCHVGVLRGRVRVQLPRLAVVTR
jgi:hypothetical protein